MAGKAPGGQHAHRYRCCCSCAQVIIFNKPQGVMQLHDRKGSHGAAVTCGDWLMDNRLGLASGTRVKVRALLKTTQYDDASLYLTTACACATRVVGIS